MKTAFRPSKRTDPSAGNRLQGVRCAISTRGAACKHDRHASQAEKRTGTTAIAYYMIGVQ
jgi:hypothetical protein